MTEGGRHAPVLLSECIEGLGAAAGGRFLDLTFGRGGHTRALLASAPNVRVVAVDRDPEAVSAGQALAAQQGERFRMVEGNFGELAALGAELGGPFQGVLADIGVSSPQIDSPERGFSFRQAGPLDMRMDRTSESLETWLRRQDETTLADVIYHYGEERRSRRIARAILEALAEGRLHTTLDLREAVMSIGGWGHPRIDPATRTFQALRIAINDELGALERMLAAVRALLAPGGRLAVITFHSLEDRLVKWTFRDDALWQPLTRRPVIANEAERAENPRARSAKLRVATRTANPDAGTTGDASLNQIEDKGEDI